MNEAVTLAHTGAISKGIYTSPQSSRSGSLSELGLTLLPSTGDQPGGSPGENHGYDCFSLQSPRGEGPQTSEDASEWFDYPTPTTSLASFQQENSDDAAKNPVKLSNSKRCKQFSAATASGSTAPLFIPLHPIDRTGRPHTGLVAPTYITVPLLYRPSAPHLHTLVSTGTTMAAAAQLDQLKERNRILTMERDRFYYLSKPATLRADDMKSEQIRQLQAQLIIAREQNAGLQAALARQANLGDTQKLQAEHRNITEQSRRLQWMLQHETARANHAEALAAQRTEEYRKLMVAYNVLITGGRFRPPNPQDMTQSMPPMSPTISHVVGETILCRESTYIDLTSPTKPITSRQGSTQRPRAPPSPTIPQTAVQTPSSASVTTPPATANQAPPQVPTTGPPSKRKRSGNNDEELQPSQNSSKRQRTSSNTDNRPAIDQPPKGERTGSTAIEKQTRKQLSMLNRSQFSDIQARVRSALKGRTGSYSWLQESGSNKAEYPHGAKLADGREVADESQPTNQAPQAEEDELSESEIAAFNKALEDAWNEEAERDGDENGDGDDDRGGDGDEDGDGGGDGDGDSLFGDLAIV